jgi:CSLREA domain-containing protein
MRKPLEALMACLLVAAPLTAATVTVNDSGDSSNPCATTGVQPCTLRDAITYANAHSGSTIAFDIPGSGVQTLQPAMPYPTIVATVTIDGYTQPGSSPNTNGPGLGDNSTHRIEIDAASQSSGYGILFLPGSSGSVLRGLVINRAVAGAVGIFASNSVTIAVSFLGTDSAGSSVPGPEPFGILIDDGATGVTVGGTAAAARNVISGGVTAGIGFGNDDGGGGADHVVEGNFIGTDASGAVAVFILKAKHGLCYTPPPCTGVFADVPCSSGFAPWIEAMAAEGITGGCGGGDFCPQNLVRRDQMAVFLLKAEHGSTYVPPVCIGVFMDVPCPSQFANWIEQLAAENITGGCGSGNYCPSMPNLRGQMAVFITRTFGLQ